MKLFIRVLNYLKKQYSATFSCCNDKSKSQIILTFHLILKTMKNAGSCYAIPQSSVKGNFIRAAEVVMMLVVLFITGCTKSEFNDDSRSADKTTPTVLSVAPGNESNAVPTLSSITVTFSEKMDTSTINKS